MKKLQRFTSATALSLLIGLPVFAGQTETPPCAPPQPGQTETPPCQSAVNGDGGTGTVSSTASATDTIINEVVADVIETMLSIF